jgi:hypothetical protein
MSKPRFLLKQIRQFLPAAIRHLASPILYLLFAIGYLLSASPARALDIGKTYSLATDRTLGDYITPLVSFAVVGAGLIAFLLFLGGGIAMIAGAGNPQQQEKGKSALTAGVIGLALVVSAFWIVQIIEVLTGLNLLNPSL